MFSQVKVAAGIHMATFKDETKPSETVKAVSVTADGELSEDAGYVGGDVPTPATWVKIRAADEATRRLS